MAPGQRPDEDAELDAQLVAKMAAGDRAAMSALYERHSGVLLGLVQTTIPLAVLPIAAALGSIPIALEEAASVLGASRLRVYRTIILPLAWPGIAAGSVLVFGFNPGAFVVPLLLGGLKVTTIAVLIRNEMGPLLNWPLGAALAARGVSRWSDASLSTGTPDPGSATWKS